MLIYQQSHPFLVGLQDRSLRVFYWISLPMLQSIVALLFFGDRIYAITALGVTVIDLLGRVNYLPINATSYYDMVAFTLSMGYLFYAGNTYVKVCMAAVLVFPVVLVFLPKDVLVAIANLNLESLFYRSTYSS